jgi:toxin FitB
LLLDSNIIIYAARPEHEALRRLISEHVPKVSIISKIETLGYHLLNSDERRFLEDFFEAAEVLPLTDEIAEEAIRLRQERRTTLGDALIAATARSNGLVLVTRNVEDFGWISGLQLLNPIGP